MFNSFNDIKNNNSDVYNVTYLDNYKGYLLNINLFLTDRCNLNCTYCFENKNKHVIDLHTADKAIEWAIDNSPQNRKLNVTFFGGEPLMCFYDIIKPIILKYRDRVTYSITTNGMLLTPDMLQFFKEFNVSVLLSIDGVPEINNIQRLGSEALFHDVFPNMVSEYTNIKLRMTITKRSIKYFYDSIQWFIKNGFTDIDIEPNIYEKWSLIDKLRFTKQVNRVYSSFSDTLHLNYFNLVKNNRCLFENSCFHCGLGTSNCSVNYRGDIYPCQEYVTAGDEFIIGNIYNGIDNKKHLQFLTTYQNKLKHIKCKNIFCHLCIKRLCISCFCPSKFIRTGTFKNKTQCRFLQSFYHVYKMNNSNRKFKNE